MKSLTLLLFSFAIFGQSMAFETSYEDIEKQLAPLLLGDRTGSGGDGLVCFKADGSIDTVEVWDYVEAEVEHGHLVNLGHGGLDYYEKMQKVVERVLSNEKIFNTGKFTQLKNYLRFFKTLGTKPTSNEFVKIVQLKGNKANFKFKEIDDAKSLIVLAKGENCKIVQLAVQEEKKSFNRAFIKIQKELWDKMDNDHKAGILLHELFIMIQRKNNPGIKNDTRYARYLNTAFSTSQYELIEQDPSKSAYLETLASVEFLYKFDFPINQEQTLYANGFALNKGNLQVDEFSNTILEGYTNGYGLDSKIYLANIELATGPNNEITSHEIINAFHKNYSGGIFFLKEELELSSPYTVHPNDKITLAKGIANKNNCNAVSTDDWGISSGTLAKDTNIITKNGDRVKALKGTTISFNANGEIVGYTVKAPITLTNYDGNPTTLGKKGQFVIIYHTYEMGDNYLLFHNATIRDEPYTQEECMY